MVSYQPLFDGLPANRYYRIRFTMVTRTNASTVWIRKTLQSMELILREHKFTCKYLSPIIDFITHLGEEVDTLYISGGKMILLLPHFAIKDSGKQYHSSKNESRTVTSVGLVHWSEAAQDLLRIYEPETAIHKAIKDIRDTLQSLIEDETVYEERLKNFA